MKNKKQMIDYNKYELDVSGFDREDLHERYEGWFDRNENQKMVKQLNERIEKALTKRLLLLGYSFESKIKLYDFLEGKLEQEIQSNTHTFYLKNTNGRIPLLSYSDKIDVDFKPSYEE